MAKNARKLASRPAAPDRTRLEFVIVAWDDHFDLQGAWVADDEIPEEGSIILTGGWLIQENDERIVIARDTDFSDERWGGVMVILKPTVRKVWKIGFLKY